MKSLHLHRGDNRVSTNYGIRAETSYTCRDVEKTTWTNEKKKVWRDVDLVVERNANRATDAQVFAKQFV